MLEDLGANVLKCYLISYDARGTIFKWLSTPVPLIL